MRLLVFLATKTTYPLTLYSVDNLIIPPNVSADVWLSRDNPLQGSLNIQYQYEKLRAHVLSGDYDAVLTVEQDIVFSPDALQKLIEADSDIAYGLYHMRHGPNFTHNVAPPPGKSLDARKWKALFNSSAVYKCAGYGYGFTLIKRRVFELLKVRGENGTGGDSDTLLAHDAEKKGLSQSTHFGVRCGHTRPDGAVIWPTADMNRPQFSTPPVWEKSRVRAIRSFGGANEDGGFFILADGEIGDVSPHIAKNLVTAGIAEYA